MESIGNLVIYIIMVFAIIGGVGAIKNPEIGIGKEFMDGVHTIGYIFVPIAGIMASIPYLTVFISKVISPIFHFIGADPAIAVTTFLASDMGGYQLANALKESYEGWIMAMIIGYMAGATIVFSIPMGLTMLDKHDHKYMALGVMSGVLAIPFGAFITTIIMVLTDTSIREVIDTSSNPTYIFNLSIVQILINLFPLFLIVIFLALGLKFLPNFMIMLFMIFGKLMDAIIKIVLVISILEICTGIFSKIFNSFGLDPIIADKENQFRALETAGNIGIMLTGTFPMVYLIKKYAAKPLGYIGKKLDLSPEGSAGLLATLANILAMFALIRYMPPKDKVINISFAVCAAFLLGDHLSFTANFQPTLILPVLIGKFSAGIIAIIFAYKLSVPAALYLEKIDKK